MTGTSVTLDGTTIPWILDFNKINKSVVSIPNWINSTPELDENVWVLTLTTLEYYFRATDAEKFIFETMLQSHTKYELIDCVHCILGDVWIQSIESEWTGNENDASPWKITMEVIGEGPFTVPPCCAPPVPVYYDVYFHSEHESNPCMNDQGKVSIDGGALQWLSLIHSVAQSLDDLTSHTVSFDISGTPWLVFDHWEFSGDITIVDINVNPATFTVTGTGTITAVFRNV
jgi:hypothetical protein